MDFSRTFLMTMGLMLEALDLSRSASSGAVLLNGACLQVSAGERWSVFGPTGSGKTLLLRALALLDAVDAGEVRWRGETIPDVAVPEFRRKVIYLHQRPALTSGTVEDNLRMPWSFQAARKEKFDRDRAKQYLEHIGQSPAFLASRADKLSGGERQIAALLRALLLNPQVLLLDELTAALDPASARKVENLVRAYLEESAETRASVWVTHDAEQVQRVADWQVPIQGGQTGEPKRVG